MSNSMVKILRKWGQKLYDEFGVGHSYYGIANACNFAADELEKQDTRIAELEAQLAKAKEVIKPFAIENPIGIPEFWKNDFIAAGEYLRMLETHANPA